MNRASALPKIHQCECYFTKIDQTLANFGTIFKMVPIKNWWAPFLSSLDKIGLPFIPASDHTVCTLGITNSREL